MACAFALTVACEGALAWVWLKNTRHVWVSFICNLLTNPAVNAALLLSVRTFGARAYWPALICLEITAVMAETAVWRALSGFSWPRSCAISLACNASSFGLGWFVSGWLF